MDEPKMVLGFDLARGEDRSVTVIRCLNCGTMATANDLIFREAVRTTMSDDKVVRGWKHRPKLASYCEVWDEPLAGYAHEPVVVCPAEHYDALVSNAAYAQSKAQQLDTRTAQLAHHVLKEQGMISREKVREALFAAFEAGWFDNHGSIADAWAGRSPELLASLGLGEET